MRVPADWHTVSYRSGSKTVTATTYTRDGATFAMVNLIPGADNATVSTAITFIN